MIEKGLPATKGATNQMAYLSNNPMLKLIFLFSMGIWANIEEKIK